MNLQCFLPLVTDTTMKSTGLVDTATMVVEDIFKVITELILVVSPREGVARIAYVGAFTVCSRQ